MDKVWRRLAAEGSLGGRPALPPGAGRSRRWLGRGLAFLALLLFLADALLFLEREPGLLVL